MLVSTVFLLGAGFNRDAKREAGRITGTRYDGVEHEIQCE